MDGSSLISAGNHRMAGGLAIAGLAHMKAPSAQRQRILLLHERAIRFSTHINQCYPKGTIAQPSRVVWDQLVRAADGVSNNLIDADAASSRADFAHRMRVALREAKESKACLMKVRLGPLANAPQVAALHLEQEADELAAIYATIIKNLETHQVPKPSSRRQR